MYGCGLSYSDIREHVLEIYGILVSTAAITDKIIDIVKALQQPTLGSGAIVYVERMPGIGTR